MDFWSVQLHLLFSCIAWGRVAFLLRPGVGDGLPWSVEGVWRPGWPPHLIEDPGICLSELYAAQAFEGAGGPAFRCCVCYWALALDGPPSYLSGLPILLRVIATPSTRPQEWRTCLSEWSVCWMALRPGLTLQPSRSPRGRLRSSSLRQWEDALSLPAVPAPGFRAPALLGPLFLEEMSPGGLGGCGPGANQLSLFPSHRPASQLLTLCSPAHLYSVVRGEFLKSSFTEDFIHCSLLLSSCSV